MKSNFIIAIDGPVGVGKGTLALALSKKFEALYINTGAMYRAATLACIKKKIDLHDENQVLNVLSKTKIELRVIDNETRVFLDGVKADAEIFSVEISNAVPVISAYASVRSQMVRIQREIVDDNKAVVEGRDIATEVAPHADLKIFLTADIKVRAQRRYKQFLAKGQDIDIKELIKDIEMRDKLDMERDASPLEVTEDAYVLDTSNLSIDQTVEKVEEQMKRNGLI